jgi:cytochrome c biogenesis protein ResB
MISALISFLGGSVFRMLWGEVSAWLTKQQDHKHELDRMHLQAELDRGQHERNMESIRVQAELGVKTIQVQAEAAINELEAQGWVEAVKGTTKPIGIAWVDAWNAVIRPGVATWAVLMMTLGELGVMVLSDNVISVTGAALGIYLADRNLMKRGK